MTLRRATLIVQPGTGWAVRAAADPMQLTRRGTFLAVTTIVLLVGGVVLLIVGPVPVKVLGAVLAISGFAWVAAAARLARRQTVAPGDWRYRGQPIAGYGRGLLMDGLIRAAEAEQAVADIPTALEWNHFRPHVEAVLWRAAGQAAEASKLDSEELAETRDEHLAAVTAARDLLAELAVSATNAAAAAHEALERTGDMGELELASSTAARLIARGGLDEALVQLTLLTETWTEISRPTPPTPRARRSRPLSGRQRAH